MVYVQVTIRIVTIMFFLLVLILITGRRKIGELPVFDFLTIIILGNVVGADIADPKIPQLPTAYAVFLMIAIQFFISYLLIKNRRFGGLITFGPTVIIQNGQLLKENLKRLRYSVENVMMYLREKGVFDVSEVDYAIIEDSGNISILRKSEFLPITPSDINLDTEKKGIAIPLIIDGKVYEKNLKKLNLTKLWLITQLKNNNINSLDEVFYVDITFDGKLNISKVIETDIITNNFDI